MTKSPINRPDTAGRLAYDKVGVTLSILPHLYFNVEQYINKSRGIGEKYEKP